MLELEKLKLLLGVSAEQQDAVLQFTLDDVEDMILAYCTVTEYWEYQKTNMATGHHEVQVLTGQPCRLSFGTVPAAEQTDTGAALQQTVKLFISPKVEIKPGSKITVAQNGVTADYCRSGLRAVYTTHQEITLEIWEGWT